MILIIICVIFIFGGKIFKKEIIKYQISTELLKFFNEEKETKYLGDDQIIWLKDAKQNVNNTYDISDFIDYYISLVDKCIEVKLGLSNFNNYKVYELLNRSYKGISIVGMIDWYYQYMVDHITDKDVELYQKNEINTELIKKLEQKIDYRNSKWEISGDDVKTVELDYGLYFEYKPNIRRDEVKPLKINKITLLNNPSEIDINKEYLIVNIKYVDRNNERKEKDVYVKIIDKSKMLLDIRDFCGLYYWNPSPATIYIKNHDYDNWQRARNEHEEEVIRLERETDPSTVLVDQGIRRIKKFEKYNRFNNHDQYASIITDVYKDGSSKAFFRKFISIDDENGKCIREEYMKRELPYKNKTIDEVMELYINDKEQYSIDEELLKTGKQLVEYELTIWTPNNGFQKVETK